MTDIGDNSFTITVGDNSLRITIGDNSFTITIQGQIQDFWKGGSYV